MRSVVIGCAVLALAACGSGSYEGNWNASGTITSTTAPAQTATVGFPFKMLAGSDGTWTLAISSCTLSYSESSVAGTLTLTTAASSCTIPQTHVVSYQGDAAAPMQAPVSVVVQTSSLVLSNGVITLTGSGTGKIVQSGGLDFMPMSFSFTASR